MRYFILISNIHIHNANALSSPYSIGFPAMTAWLGAVHALQRHLHSTLDHDLQSIRLNKTAVSCHHFDLQTYKGDNDFVHSIVGTANPLDKDGGRPAFIEEARCHLDVSLLIECCGVNPDKKEVLIQTVTDLLHGKMKMASGDILRVGNIDYLSIDENSEAQCQSLVRRLMPGHVLIERRDLLKARMVEEGCDALTALLDYIKVKHRAAEQKEKIKWTINREAAGWLVPIAVGFQGISRVGQAQHQRDSETPHRFAESIVTLGEFIMPYRIKRLDYMLWQYHVDLEKALYLCQNRDLTIN